MTANQSIKVRATIRRKIGSDCPADCQGDWCDNCPYTFPQRPRRVPDIHATAECIVYINPIYNYLKV